MIRKILVYSITIIIFSVKGSIAQQALEYNRDKIKEEIKTTSFTPFSSQALPNLISNFSLSSYFKEGENAKMEVAGTLKKNSNTHISVSIDQKLGKDDKEATPLDMSGISPGTTVQGALTHMFWQKREHKTDDFLATKQWEIIKKYAATKHKDPTHVGLEEVHDSGTNAQKREVYKYYRQFFSSQPLFVTIKGGFTKTSFSYATDSVKLTKIDESFITPTVTFSLVKALGRAFKVNGYFSLSYTYSENYTAADDVSFMSPFGLSGNYYSQMLAFGKPEKKSTNNITLEFRKNFKVANADGKTHLLAIAPSIINSLDRNKLSIQLPLYFIRGSDDKGNLLSNLQGGVRFGYITRTDTQWSDFKDGFTAQLIITEPLDVLKGLSGL